MTAFTNVSNKEETLHAVSAAPSFIVHFDQIGLRHDTFIFDPPPVDLLLYVRTYPNATSGVYKCHTKQIVVPVLRKIFHWTSPFFSVRFFSHFVFNQ